MSSIGQEEEDLVRKAMSEWKQELKQGIEEQRKTIAKSELRLEILRAKQNVLESASRRFQDPEQRRLFYEANAGELENEIETEERFLEGFKAKYRVETSHARLIIEYIEAQ
ncbi:hypothetical protein M2277_000827 [Paenibacillus sp. LBL]|uniref:hypothetical protein n=1 Tax=Paenibacillus sp. LBL TaxID=2940563 RepID=UPI002472F362|nr:hypothetical protein [Paenibacillus sp. LBL]MDH6670183.1 hypothetical protein [Paenibacillus sp. LBL]